MEAFAYKPSRKNLTILFIVSFLVRAITFQLYLSHNERYKQPDSMDYHNCAVSLVMGAGMHRADTLEPIFWRTPGYPLYISWFYNLFGLQSTKFSPNRPAQLTALWLQILLSSLIPVFIFLLVHMLTGILSLAWLTSLICTFHHGVVLSSGYFLTEALALVFFFPFLIFFYKSFRVRWEKKKEKPQWHKSIILAALFLGIMTWIRPMGEFVSVLVALIIITLGAATLTTKLKKLGLFFLVFFVITGGWYLRNNQISGKLFFCPMFGPYLNSFCAPKILRETHKLPLEECIRYQYRLARQEAERFELDAFKQGKRLCKEHAALHVAVPIIKQHPFMFLRNWFKELFKTTFDLYASQLVEFEKNTFTYDPLEEFLTEKWAECVYHQPMPFAMRLIVFLEILFELLKWIGLLFGFWIFMLFPLLKQFRVSEQIKKTGLLWLKVAPIIGALIFMTGGFGYARLRLPVEPLMIMLSLTFWYWALRRKQ